MLGAQTEVLDIKGGIAKSDTNGPNTVAKASSGTSALGGTKDPFQDLVSARQEAPPDHENADKSGPINPDEFGGFLDIDLVKAVAHARAQSSFVNGRSSSRSAGRTPCLAAFASGPQTHHCPATSTTVRC